MWEQSHIKFDNLLPVLTRKVVGCKISNCFCFYYFIIRSSIIIFRRVLLPTRLYFSVGPYYSVCRTLSILLFYGRRISSGKRYGDMIAYLDLSPSYHVQKIIIITTTNGRYFSIQYIVLSPCYFHNPLRLENEDCLKSIFFFFFWFFTSYRPLFSCSSSSRMPYKRNSL